MAKKNITITCILLIVLIAVGVSLVPFAVRQAGWATLPASHQWQLGGGEVPVARLNLSRDLLTASLLDANSAAPSLGVLSLTRDLLLGGNLSLELDLNRSRRNVVALNATLGVLELPVAATKQL